MSQDPSALELVLNAEGLPERGSTVAVAVSGGADSFALLHHLYTEGWAVHALTVDHGFRAESAAEAQAVAAWCSDRGIPHQTLVWQEEKPASGRQAAARAARYKLLCEACNRLGIRWLVTAHTADDQAETVFMRMRRGSGRGLAAMPITRRIAAGPAETITLARPMLALRRDAVRAYAEGHDLPIQDDPSNDDPTFERIRLRAVLAALEQQDLLTVEALCRVADEVRWANCEPVPASGQVRISDDGAFIIEPSMVLDADPDKAAFVSWAIAAVGHAERWATYRMQRLQDHFLPPLTNPDVIGNTVGGAMLHHGLITRTLVFREPASVLGRADGTPGLPPMSVRPGKDYVFDRRFIVTIPDDIAPGALLRPLGQMLPRKIATSTLARQRVATLPCLATEDAITHVPAEARQMIFDAFSGWKLTAEHLPAEMKEFETVSLLAERFSGDVIRY